MLMRPERENCLIIFIFLLIQILILKFQAATDWFESTETNSILSSRSSECHLQEHLYAEYR